MTYSNSCTARRLRAQFLSSDTMNYWSIIQRTLNALQIGASMKTTCRSAAQLTPKHGNPARDLMARFL